jgi:hypothetical protein
MGPRLDLAVDKRENPNGQKALKSMQLSWAWWCTLEIPAFGRLRQEDRDFKVSLGFMTRLS